MRYIIRNGKKIELTYEDEQSLTRQGYIQTARNVIELFGDSIFPWVKNLNDDKLAQIGQDIENDYMANMGDREYDVLRRFGLLRNGDSMEYVDGNKQIITVDGDIFESNADIILHQVNCQGVMGSGVAKQVKEKFPNVFNAYKQQCDFYRNNKRALLGYAQYVVTSPGKYIGNLFAQENYGYNGVCYTDYNALRECLKLVNGAFRDKSVAIPYLMECHRGGGDWNIVSKMIEDELTSCSVTLYKYNG